ncbi:MAG: hypothetical protein LBT66_03560 [Methanobrevibacter sp.]|jgi:hypothetical protein|nr:hypothetical protein [Candidatus Methanovirga meridionalis]
MDLKCFKIKKCNNVKIDSNGIATIEFLFFIFTTVLIAIIIMGLFQSQINSLYTLDENVQGRIILENISNQFNQISQSLESISTEIYLPDKIANYKYSITIDNRNLILEFNNKKTRETIFPINLFNKNGDRINDIKLYSGNTYIITSVSTKNGVMIRSSN